VFGLIGFVKKAAEKENQNFVIGIWSVLPLLYYTTQMVAE
jgi:hypothetical protein